MFEWIRPKKYPEWYNYRNDTVIKELMVIMRGVSLDRLQTLAGYAEHFPDDLLKTLQNITIARDSLEKEAIRRICKGFTRDENEYICRVLKEKPIILVYAIRNAVWDRTPVWCS